MNLKNFRFDTDADGVALVTWDMPGRSMNVIDPDVMSEIGEIVDRLSTSIIARSTSMAARSRLAIRSARPGR